jgi:hypothetical protein
MLSAGAFNLRRFVHRRLDRAVVLARVEEDDVINTPAPQWDWCVFAACSGDHGDRNDCAGERRITNPEHGAAINNCKLGFNPERTPRVYIPIRARDGSSNRTPIDHRAIDASIEGCE